MVQEHSLDHLDMMRGEEAESMALIDLYFDTRPMLLILPGSHNKYIHIDEQKQIVRCTTSMSGEILSSLTMHTILASSVNENYVTADQLDMDYLKLGYSNSLQFGFGRSTYLTRVYDLFSNASLEQLQSYLLGTVLSTDMDALKHMAPLLCNGHCQIVIGGEHASSLALACLLQERYRNCQIILDKTPELSGLGMRLIGEASYK